MLQENGRSFIVAFSDEMVVNEIKDTQKFKVCDGHNSFIKTAAINDFLETVDTSKMCLDRKD